MINLKRKRPNANDPTADPMRPYYLDPVRVKQYSTDRFKSSARRRRTDNLEKKIITSFLRRALKNEVAQKILDIPCGAGRFTDLVAEFSRFRLHADRSVEMVKETASKCGKKANTTFVAGSIFDAPFPDSAFDAAICIRLLHHFSDHGVTVKALKEIQRLAPICVVTFYDAQSLQHLRRKRKEKKKGRLSKRYAISRFQFQSAVREANWHVKKLQGIHRFISEQTIALLVRNESA